jgi:hypothetical protein
MKIRLVTVVWGREFADMFLRVGLRTLLAEGNAAALARAHQVIYTIYTTPEDAQLMEAAPAFVRLRRDVDVRVSLFTPAEIDRNNHGSHGLFWNRAVELARRNAEIVFFIIPDVLYAAGTLLRWAARFEAGAGAIFTIGPQVVQETILQELAERFPDGGTACSLDRDELHDLLFRHFHPLHAAMRHDSTRRPPHPEYDLRLVRGRGFVIREIVSHPFCVDPRRYASLRHYGPQDHLDSIAFEPCCTLSVEPLLKRMHLYYRPWPLDEARLSNLAGWWDCFTTAACERESAFPFDITCNDDAAWQAGRRRAVAGGRFYRSQILAAGRLYQLFVALRNREAYKASNLLAFAVYAGRLRRRLCVREGATILVPSERALAADAGRIDALLAPGREQELIDLIADHVILRKDDVDKSRRFRCRLARDGGGQAAADDALFTARGLPAEPLLRAIAPSDPPFSAGPFTVVVVDRVLWREPAARTDTPATVPADSAATVPVDIAATVTMDTAATVTMDTAATVTTDTAATATMDAAAIRPKSQADTFVVTKWGRRSRFHRALYYALHVPFLEPIVAIVFPVYFLPPAQKALLRNRFVRRAWERWQRGRFKLGCWAYAVAGRLEAVPRLGPIVRKARRAVEDVVPLLSRFRRVVRRDGVTIARRKVHARVRAAMAVIFFEKKPLGFPNEQRELLDQVRTIRVFQAIEEVLGDLEDKMGTGLFRSVPLAALRVLLRDEGFNRTRVEDCLTGMTRRFPSWSEAWLELGFLYEEQGRLEEALASFTKAMQGSRLTDLAGRAPHPVAIAAASCGRLLALAGRDAEASACFSRVLKLDPDQKMVAVEYANVLRRLGRIDQALAYYGEGMYYQESRWGLPAAPRDFHDLRFHRLAGGTKEPLARRRAPAVEVGDKSILAAVPCEVEPC